MKTAGVKIFENKLTELTRTLISCDKLVIVNQGGTASGKTWAILFTLIYHSLNEPNIITTVVADTIPNLKRGALRDLIHIINQNPGLKSYVQDYNRTDRVITFTNGSIIEFNSYADEQDAKSGKRDYLFVNEANGVEWGIYWQLSIRTRKQRFIDYNPSTAFWAHDKLIGQPDTAYFRTTHRQNPYLTRRQHQEIESISDPDYRRVYTLGLTGNIKGLIYKNWRPVDVWPEGIEDIIWGLYFGYTNDPTALVKVGIRKAGREVFIKECSYKPGIEMSDIKEILIKNGHIEGEPIYCDHDNLNISQLRRLGLYAVQAHKGESSIKNGILKLQSMTVFYLNSSENLIFEVNRYKWRVVDGMTLNKPDESTPDHLLDACRYAVYSHLISNEY